MSFQDLPDIATKTTETLEKLWDVIGVSQVDRQKQLDEIIVQIKGVYADAVKTEESRISQLKLDIATSIDRIDVIRSQLNQSGSYKRKDVRREMMHDVWSFMFTLTSPVISFTGHSTRATGQVSGRPTST
jgi:hypothetical protein